jgi:hypothetical protein
MSRKLEKSIVNEEVRERPVRKAVKLPTNLIVAGNKHSGFVINISSKGVGMFVINTTFPESTINGTKGSLLKLEVQSTLGVYLTLQCRIRWLRIIKSSSRGMTTSMGMEVIDPPPSFIKLCKSLFS